MYDVRKRQREVYWSNLEPIEFEEEDVTFGGNELFVDLIPQTSWGANVRNAVSRRMWQRIRKHCVERANGVCELCDAKPASLDVHERWNYDGDSQRLRRLVALCKMCHLVTHIGFADTQGMGDDARRHLMRVRAWTRTEVEDHIAEAFALWEKRNGVVWRVQIPAALGATSCV